MAWSCHQDPNQSEDLRRLCDLETPDGASLGATPEQRQIRELLHWVSLITGNFLRQRPQHFPSDGRADRLLLKNLRHVRRSLIEAGLDRDVTHDLLARIIFTQFLFHRKDSAGNPFFSKTLLAKRCDGSLRQVHSDLASILPDKDEAYALFRWMDGRFNGDLFPGGDDQTDEECEDAWRAEKEAVRPEHLQLLADLVSGTIDTTDRQLRLWPQYSFDTIPLEFISSVYEEFLTEDRDANKAYYTPPHLVDYVLDAVLPWDGAEWNLRILDPACGSGIFLVKAFQRLIHRWRRVHEREPLVSDLKPLLADNVYGVDINPNAVRVACFSLYLAMADAIDPKHYVTRERVFPRLRGKRLIARDFFDETTEGFRTVEDAGAFDLVIGNAPWGDRSAQKTSEIVPDEPPTPGRRKKKAAPKTKAETWAAPTDGPSRTMTSGRCSWPRDWSLSTNRGEWRWCSQRRLGCTTGQNRHWPCDRSSSLPSRWTKSRTSRLSDGNCSRASLGRRACWWWAEGRPIRRPRSSTSPPSRSAIRHKARSSKLSPRTFRGYLMTKRGAILWFGPCWPWAGGGICTWSIVCCVSPTWPN